MQHENLVENCIEKLILHLHFYFGLFRLARAGPRSESTVYEMVRIDGCFRRADQAPRGRPNSGPTGLQLIRRARGRDDSIPLHSISGNDVVSYFSY
jgi:hypothetical protein